MCYSIPVENKKENIRLLQIIVISTWFFFSNSASYWLDALEFFSGLPKNINNSYNTVTLKYLQ